MTTSLLTTYQESKKLNARNYNCQRRIYETSSEVQLQSVENLSNAIADMQEIWRYFPLELSYATSSKSRFNFV
jgi:hypothetical protein